MNKRVGTIGCILFPILIGGCSSVPEKSPDFKFESKEVQIIVELVNKEESIVLFDKYTQFVPNYAPMNYEYKTGSERSFFIEYNYFDSSITSKCDSNAVSECHMFKYELEDGIDLKLTYVGEDSLFFNIAVTQQLKQAGVNEALPSTVKTQVKGHAKLEGNKKTTFSDLSGVYIDSNGDEHQYNIKSSYKVVG